MTPESAGRLASALEMTREQLLNAVQLQPAPVDGDQPHGVRANASGARSPVVSGADPLWSVAAPVIVTIGARSAGCDVAVPGRLLPAGTSVVDDDPVLRAAVWRMGLARWATTFHPLPLSADLAGLDLLTACDAGWQLGLNVDTEAQTALSAMTTAGDQRWQTLAYRLRAGVFSPQVSEQLQPAMQALARWLPMTSAARTTIEQIIDGDDPDSAGTIAQVDSDAGVIDGADGSWVRPLSAASHMSGLSLEEGELKRWTTDVDWAQVPPGVLDPGEGTVAVAVGGRPRRVRVEVRAAMDLDGLSRRVGVATSLRFRMLQPDLTADARGRWELIADGTLQLDDDTGVYAGQVRLAADCELNSAVVVDVYDALSPHPPRVAAARQQATVQRHASHAVAYERLAAISDAAHSTSLLRAARTSWSAAAAATRDHPQAAAVAAAGQLRCLNGLPDVHPAVQLRAARLAESHPRLAEADDAARLAAGPLLAELALVHPRLAG